MSEAADPVKRRRGGRREKEKKERIAAAAAGAASAPTAAPSGRKEGVEKGEGGQGSRVKREKLPKKDTPTGDIPPPRSRRSDAKRKTTADSQSAKPNERPVKPTERTSRSTPKSNSTRSVATVVVEQTGSTSRRSHRDKKETKDRKEKVERSRGGRDRKVSSHRVVKTAIIDTNNQKLRSVRTMRMGSVEDSLEGVGGDVHFLTLRNLDWGIAETDITAVLDQDPKLKELHATGGIKVYYVAKGHGRKAVVALSAVDAISRSSFASLVGSGLFDTGTTEPILAHYSSYFGAQAGKLTSPAVSTSHAILYVANPAHIPLVSAVFDRKQIPNNGSLTPNLPLCIVEHSMTQPVAHSQACATCGTLYSDGDFFQFAESVVRQQQAVEAHVQKIDARLVSSTVPAEGAAPSPTLRGRLPCPVDAPGLLEAVTKPVGGKVDGIGFDCTEAEMKSLENGLIDVAPDATKEDDDDDAAVKMRLQAWVMTNQAAEMRREMHVRSVFDGEDVEGEGEGEAGQNRMMLAVMKEWVGPSGVASSRGGGRQARTPATGEGAVLKQLRDAKKEEKEKAETDRIHKIIEMRRAEKKERDTEIRRKEQAASDAARQLGVLTETTEAAAKETTVRDPPFRVAKRQEPSAVSGESSGSSFTVSSARQGAGGVIGVRKR